MSSLADALLDELEDEATENQDEVVDEEVSHNPLKRKAADSDDELMSGDDDAGGEDGGATLEGGVAPGGIAPAQELDEEEVEKMDMADVEDVRNIAKLEGSKRMVEVLQVSEMPYAVVLITHSKVRSVSRILTSILKNPQTTPPCRWTILSMHSS